MRLCAIMGGWGGARSRLRVTDEERRASGVGLKNNIDTALWRWEQGMRSGGDVEEGGLR
jgi:hypothetical protein